MPNRTAGWRTEEPGMPRNAGVWPAKISFLRTETEFHPQTERGNLTTLFAFLETGRL